jgi:hypothetical protein
VGEEQMEFTACLPLGAGLSRRHLAAGSRRASREASLSGSPEQPGSTMASITYGERIARRAGQPAVPACDALLSCSGGGEGGRGAAVGAGRGAAPQADRQAGRQAGGGGARPEPAAVAAAAAAGEHPDLGSRSGGASRRASRDGRDGAAAGPPGALAGGERLDTVEEGGASRASSQAQLQGQQQGQRSPLASPFTAFAGAFSQGPDRAEEGGGSEDEGDAPLAAVHVRGAGGRKGRLDPEAERKLHMLARIRLDLEASTSDGGSGGGSGGGAPPGAAASAAASAQQGLQAAGSLLAAAPSALLDAVLKPFRRSANRVQPTEQHQQQQQQQAAGGSPEAGRAPGAAAAEEEDDEEDMCGVCLDVDVNALMRPCRHRICVACAKDLCRRYTVATALCPYCRATISDFEYARAS